MKSRPTDTAPRFGSILPGEVLPVEEAARRLGWRKRLTIDVQRMGLRSVLIGRRKYTTVDWGRHFIEEQADREAAENTTSHHEYTRALDSIGLEVL